MKLKYIKIGHNDWKFFYETNGRYGEFYINFKDVTKASGEADLLYKDMDYAQDLIAGLTEEFNGWADGTLDEVAATKEKERKEPPPYQKYFDDQFDNVMDKLDDLMGEANKISNNVDAVGSHVV